MPRDTVEALTTEFAGPLTSSEAGRARLVAERLRSELHTLLRRVPQSPRSALSLSKDWGLDRNISQKVLSALAPGIDAPTILSRLPGVDSLRKFVAAASTAAGMKSSDRAASAAVDAFDALVREVAGSQTRLIRRLRSESTAATSASEPQRSAEIDARRRLFHDAADVLGVTVDLLPHVGLIRPVPGQPDQTEGARAFGLLGLKWDDGPLPVRSYASAHHGDADELIAQMQHSSLSDRLSPHQGILPEFCSTPLPALTARESPGMTVLTIDPPSNKSAIDLVFGQRWGTDKHPTCYDEPVWSQFVGIKRPTRRLVFDVYMHRSMAMSCVPAIGAYRWCPDITADPLKHWDERLPGRLTLELLGPGLTNAGSPAWPRQGELARFVFNEIGWDPDEFVGFRCDAAYPIWNSAFFMSFDFRDPAALKSV